MFFMIYQFIDKDNINDYNDISELVDNTKGTTVITAEDGTDMTDQCLAVSLSPFVCVIRLDRTC